MGRHAKACRTGKEKRSRRRGSPEETVKYARILSGTKCREPYLDSQGRLHHHRTTVNFTKEIGSHPNTVMCLCCEDSRRKIADSVWRRTKKAGFIGVLISKVPKEPDTVLRRRRDGRRFPAKIVVRNNAVVKTFQALWCEMDRGTLREQWQRLRSFGVFPTMIVWSGGKSLHAYWVLAEPTDRERFNSVMPRLCAQLLGDGKAIHAMHQLRLPGSIHAKSGMRARLVFADERYPAIDEIEEALTLPMEEVTAYMDKELGRNRWRADHAGGDDCRDSRSDNHDETQSVLNGLEELRAFDDGDDEMILGMAHTVFGDLRKDERHATTLALIRWCHRKMSMPEEDAGRVIKQFILRYPGTSEGANERPEEVTRQVDALVANWYGKAHLPGIEYAEIEDLENCVREIAQSIPPDWTRADASGFDDWLTGFIRYLTAIAHRRNLSCFRRHSLHARRDIEGLGRLRRKATHKTGRDAPHDCHKADSRRNAMTSDLVACKQGLSRAGRPMAFKGFHHLLATGFVVQVAKHVRYKRTALYDITIPILSPQVWERHRHETAADWAARGAEFDASGENLHLVLSERRRSQGRP